MEKRNLDITVNSASSLDNVRTIGQLKAYVVVFISNNPSAKQQTHTDETGKTNPAWNFTMTFSLGSEFEFQQSHQLCAVFQLHSQRTLGDKCIGEVRVPLRGLFARAEAAGLLGYAQFSSYPVSRSNESPKGLLHVSFRFHELASSAAPQPPRFGAVPAPAQFSASFRPQQGSGFRFPAAAAAPSRPNPQQASSSKFAKAGLAIGAGSFSVGISSLGVNVAGLTKDGNGGGGAGGAGEGAVYNHNELGLDPLGEGVYLDPNNYEALGLQEGVYLDPNNYEASGLQEGDYNGQYDSWFPDHNVVDPTYVPDQSISFVDQPCTVPDASFVHVPDVSGGFFG